jgi:hypothetical protein
MKWAPRSLVKTVIPMYVGMQIEGIAMAYEVISVDAGRLGIEYKDYSYYYINSSIFIDYGT